MLTNSRLFVSDRLIHAVILPPVTGWIDITLHRRLPKCSALCDFACLISCHASRFAFVYPGVLVFIFRGHSVTLFLRLFSQDIVMSSKPSCPSWNEDSAVTTGLLESFNSAAAYSTYRGELFPLSQSHELFRVELVCRGDAMET